MRFQFSLATLLVCITVLAMVCGLSVLVPVRVEEMYHEEVAPGISRIRPVSESREPNSSEIVRRLALWGPASIAATLGALWIGRRVIKT